MRIGITSSRHLTGLISKTPASLVTGQVASSRGGAPITLPKRPEPGNLLVVVVVGSRNIPDISTPRGFAMGGDYISTSSAANTGVVVYSKRALDNESATITMTGSNVIATAYEFRDAITALGIIGGSVDQYSSGDTFSLAMEKSPFGPLDAIVGAVGVNQNFPLVLSPNDSIIQDYSNTAPFGDFGGVTFRVKKPYPTNIIGVVSGSPSLVSPVYGLFAVISKHTPE